MLCETVDYTFQIINTNCDARTVNFIEVLPADMEWVMNSVTLNSTTVTANDIVYNGKNLAITNISVHGVALVITKPRLLELRAIYPLGVLANQLSNSLELTVNKLMAIVELEGTSPNGVIGT